MTRMSSVCIVMMLMMKVEDVLLDPVWPSKWPYSFEDFRPLDYTRDEVTNTAVQYSYSQR